MFKVLFFLYSPRCHSGKPTTVTVLRYFVLLYTLRFIFKRRLIRTSSYLLVVAQCKVATEEKNVYNREEWPDNIVTSREKRGHHDNGTLSATKTDPFDVLPSYVYWPLLLVHRPLLGTTGHAG